MPNPPSQEKPTLLGPWKRLRTPKHRKVALGLLSSGLVLGVVPILLSLVFGSESHMGLMILLVFGPMVGILAILVGLLCLNQLEYLRSFGAKPGYDQKAKKRVRPIPAKLTLHNDGQPISEEWGEVSSEDGLLRFVGTHTSFAMPHKPTRTQEGVVKCSADKRQVLISLDGRPIATLSFDPLHHDHGPQIESRLQHWQTQKLAEDAPVSFPSLLAPRHRSFTGVSRFAEYAVASVVFLAAIAILPAVYQNMLPRLGEWILSTAWYTKLGAALILVFGTLHFSATALRLIRQFHTSIKQADKEHREKEAYVLSDASLVDLAPMTATIEGDAVPGRLKQTHGS